MKNKFPQTNYLRCALAAATLQCMALSASAADVVKADNADALNLTTSWVGGAVPGSSDVAVWNNTVTSANSTLLGANTSWSGIRIADPAGAATIGAGNTLTLGAGGIDMSSATADLTLASGVTLLDNAVQTWSVPSGRSLSLSGTFARSGGGVFTVNGDGAINIAGGTASSVLPYSLFNGTDVGALDASKNVSSVSSVIGYIDNPPSGVPSSLYMDMTSAIGETGNDWYTSGSTTYYFSVLRFNTPNPYRNYWQLFGHNLILLNGNKGAQTVLVTTNVGACDVILTGDGSGGASIGMRQTSVGSEYIFDQENTLGSLYINLGFSVKSQLAGNMVTKRGAGRVVVNTDLWYPGPTRIIEGELQLNGINQDNSVITVSSGGTLSGNATVSTGSVTNSGTLYPGSTSGLEVMTIKSLTLNANSYLSFYHTTTAVTNTTALLNLTGALNFGGAVNVRILAGYVAVGQYPLLQWTNAISGSAFANFNLAQLPLRTEGYLSNNVANNSIDLVVTNVNEPVKWAVGNAVWDIATTANWKDTLGVSTTYQQSGAAGDSVLFDDTASGASPVTVTLNVSPVPAGVTINASKNYIFTGNGDIAGGGGVTKNGSGTLTLQTTNSFTGGLNINGGVVLFNDFTNLGQGGISFGGGTLKYPSGYTEDLSARTVTFASGQGTIDDNGNDLSFANAIGNNGAGGFTKAGSGTMTLNGTNNYAGNTVVAGGTLYLNYGTYISNSVAIIVNSGAVLDAYNSGVGLTLAGSPAQILAGVGAVNGTVISSNGVITPGTNGVVGTLTFGNDLTIAGGSVNFDLSTDPAQRDLMVINGALYIYDGTLNLNVTGTLTNGVYKIIQCPNGLSSGSGSSASMKVAGFSQPGQSATLSDATSGEIDLIVADTASDHLVWSSSGYYWDLGVSQSWLNGATPWTFTNGDFVTFDDTGSSSVSLQAAVAPGSVTVNNNTVNYDFTDGTGTGGGKISGSTALVKGGTGTLMIETANDYSGPTTINSGTVQVGNSGTHGDLGTGPVTNNGALVYMQADNHSQVGAITGSGSLTQSGSGTLTLMKNNTYTGPTTIGSGASLQVGNGGAVGSLGSGSVTNDGTLIFNHTGTFAVGNIKTGPSSGGAVTFSGAANVTLNNGNTYINNTAVNGGVVKVGAADSIPSAATVAGSTGWLVLDGGSTAGVLDLNGFDVTVNDLSGTSGTVNGVITNSSASGTNVLTVGNADTTTYNGLIADSASGGKITLRKVGTGLLQLRGGNTFSGGTIINGGTLDLYGGGTVGAGLITLDGGAEGATLYQDNTGLGNTYTVTNIGTNMLEFRATTYPGFKLVGAGQVNLNLINYGLFTPQGDWSGFSGTIVFTNTAGDLAHARANANPFGSSQAIWDLGALGDLYQRTAGVVINMGALKGLAGSSLNTARFVIGALNLDTTYSGTFGGTAILEKVGTGSLTLDGTVTYTGSTTVSGGALILGSAANDSVSLDSSPTITLQSNAVLDVSARSDATLNLGNSVAQTLSGVGIINGSLYEGGNSFVNVGLGVLNVTNAATFYGGITLQLNNTNAITHSEITAASFTMSGPLTVTNVGPDLVTGAKFQLFSAPVSGFTAVDLPTTNLLNTVTYVWTNKLAIDGSIELLSGASAINANPPPLITSFNGTTLALSWPTNSGWILQMQTNNLAAGLGTNWVDVPGSANITSTNITVNAAQPTVFYRLRLP